MKNVRNAVALSYPEDVPAPIIIARGRNELASRMLEIAGEYGISVVRDPVLADILTEEEIGACVPVETWQAVAAIFAFLEKGMNDGLF